MLNFKAKLFDFNKFSYWNLKAYQKPFSLVESYLTIAQHEHIGDTVSKRGTVHKSNSPITCLKYAEIQ